LLALLTELKPTHTFTCISNSTQDTLSGLIRGNAADFLTLLEFPFGEKLRQRAQVTYTGTQQLINRGYPFVSVCVCVCVCVCDECM
jgi:hypothetical protein